LKELQPGEVVEHLAGPQDVLEGSDLRVRGVACHEEVSGWLHVRDKKGGTLAALSTDVQKCMEAVAMTDVADFGKCTMVRRINAGEALVLLPDKAVKPSEGGSRSKFRACSDGREGWVTTLGSQGTVYVKPGQKHYVCQQATPMHAGLGAESAVVRVLMPGEAFAAFEEPREVAGAARQTLYRVRTADNEEGWISSTVDEEVQAWSSRCVVLKPSPLTKTLPANEAAEVIEVVRLLEPGEVVDVVELPTLDVTTGQLRARCVARNDKALGWTTVRDGRGADALFLRPAQDEDVQVEKAPTTPPLAPMGRIVPPRVAFAAAAGQGGVKRPSFTSVQVKEETYEDAPWAKRHKGKGKGAGL
jgi:hypothetical protein